MKTFNTKFLSIILIFLMVVSLTACNQTGNANEKIQNENVSYEGISKTNLGEDYGLKQFEICEMKSAQDNTYTFLRFSNPKVANRKDDTYYSQSDVLADMYVMIKEGDEFKNSTMEDIIDDAASYVSKNITSLHYHEEDNIAYKLIKYDIYDEKKDKIIICEKTDTGYVVHDFSYFDDCTVEEKNTIKECIHDICTVFGISLDM